MKICGVETDTCPEVVLAFLIAGFQLEGGKENFFKTIQQIHRFGPKTSELQIVDSEEQLTEDQYRWLGWWTDYFAEIKESDELSETLFDSITIWERTQKIDESKWRPQGNWQNYNGIIFA